jgi:hypothetical protein
VLTPATRQARSGEVSIAYQVVGEGPFDLIWRRELDRFGGREADTAGDGRAELTGVPGEWQLYVVEPGA